MESPARGLSMRFMFSKPSVQHFLAPPGAAGDEEETQRAGLLRTITLIALLYLGLIIPIHAFGSRTATVLLLDLAALGLVLLLYYLLRRGRLALVGSTLAVPFIWVTIAGASLGLIRTPAAAAYLALVILAGLLFGWPGIRVSAIASSLLVLGLILAQRAGLLPQANGQVTFAQWFTYTSLFGLVGGLAIYTYQSNRLALRRARQEVDRRQQAEATLRESQQHFEDLFRNNPAIMALTTFPERRFFDANQSFLRVTGYAMDELLGQTAAELNLVVQPELLDAAIARLSPGKGLVSDVEIRIRCKDGRLVDGLFWGEVIQRQGRDYLLSVIIDVTEHRRLETALAAQRQRLDNIIQSTHAGTWEWDIQSGKVTFNERWAQLIGYTLPELGAISGCPWASFTHPDDLDICNRLLQKHFMGQTDYHQCEIRLRHKDEHWVWVVGRGKVTTWAEDGRPLLMCGTHQDITERKQAEELMSEREARYRALVEASPDGIILSDLQGHILAGNAQAARLHGYDNVASLLGMKVLDLVAPHEIPRCIEALDQAVQQGPQTNVEYVLRRADGSKFIGALSVAVIYDTSSGGPLRVILQTRDITQRKPAEQALEKALADNRTLLRELQHRAKNSFTMITNVIWLMKATGLGEEANGALSEVANRVMAMANLYDLLYANDAVMDAPLDTYCARVVAALPIPHNIQVVEAYDQVTVPTDTAALVGLILTELLTNALKYAFPGDRPGTISVTLCRSGGNAILRVEDNGVGIPPGYDPARSGSLGMTLIGILAGQIQGSARCEADKGTLGVVEFPV